MRAPLRQAAVAVFALAAALLVAPLAAAAACEGPAAVCSEASAGSFPVVQQGRPAAIWIDGKDDAGVLRAAADLQTDMRRVAGTWTPMTSAQPPKAGPVIIAGTMGRNAVIERLVRERKLDVSGVRGQWEGFIHQVVEAPLPGVERALVIAGSDKRGTIFGIYDLSERMGVSPWNWWADVPVVRRTEVHVTPGVRAETPGVRYRGIFLNDENPALYTWVNDTYGGFNHKFYTRVFELMLRMKANYLWPAMWGKAFADDDPLNARLADEYGIVVGTSHHEPLMRAHVEWERYGQGKWDYSTNAARLREFWRGGVARMGEHESIVTIGMRGDGDEPMTEGTAISLLERIVADQRKIIAEVTGKPAARTPQIWALYKEVQDYYDKGMRVPEDVTLLFADDNWGNIRRLPKPGQKQAGGFGVYYHFDYVGGPRNYKWLNTNQIERTWEQMHLAHAHGADRMWIVNVGDLKPMEYPTEFFLDYAWNPEAMTLERLAAYSREWAAQQFGKAQAAEIGELLTRYTQYNARRKPELIDADTFSLIHFREAERVIADWEALERRAERVRDALPRETHDAYFQLVQFPIQASANHNKLYVAAGRNRLYARQGRVTANDMAAQVEQLFAHDAELTRQYHHDVAGGKWNGIMSQTHIGYTGWQQPETQVMPEVRRVQPAKGAAMGAAIEGDARAWPEASGAPAVLPALEPAGPSSRYIEVFAKASRPVRFSARPARPWVRVSQRSGETAGEARIEVSVDWATAPRGSHRVPVAVRGSDGTAVTVIAPVNNTGPAPAAGFVEADGHVAMEAGHYARAVSAGGVGWRTIPELGRTVAGVTPFPVTALAQTPGGGSPRLEYPVHLTSAGEVEVQVVLAPTLDFKGRGGLRYAVSIDDGPIQIVNVHADSSEAAWERAVADNARVLSSKHRVSAAGAHTVKIWMVDPGLVFERVLVVRGDKLPPSYLGPPESLRQGQAAAR